MVSDAQSANSGVLAVDPAESNPPPPARVFTGYRPLEFLTRRERTRNRRRMTPGLFFSRARRDHQFGLALFLALPVAAIELIVRNAPAALILSTTGGFLVLQAILTARGPRAWATARLALSVAFVIVANAHAGDRAIGPVGALMVPVVALAAATGTRGSIAVAFLGFLSTVAPAALPGFATPERNAALAMASAEIVLAFGTRRVVTSLESSIERTRQARARDRRRARQLAAVEEVGRLLAREGPRSDVLARVMEILELTFEFRYPSVFLWDGKVLRLGAHRNYAQPIQVFDTAHGVIGRVARTHVPAFVPDVRLDPDYLAVDPAVTSEISVPLLSGDALLGVLTVESNSARRLDYQDFATMQIVGDRLAAALALGHERMKLTQRGDLLARLTEFSAGLSATQDPATFHAMVADGAARVIAGDMIVLVLLNRDSGEFHSVAVAGGDSQMVGIRILPGEGASGRAIAEGCLIVDDHLDRARFPRQAESAKVPDVLASMAVPLRGGNEVIGAITWLRGDLTRPYSPEEQEVASLLGVQASLALVNDGLLQDARQAAITDPLTGLHNRRFFDSSYAHLLALRARDAEEDRSPLSAIMFDLDHFGLVNKLHGHQTGDLILRAFANALASRVRAGDLVARFGGEEFLVVLPGATRDQAAQLADDVRERFAAVRVETAGGEPVSCTVSAGCSALAKANVDGETLLAMADVALAMAKAGGRNQVVIA
ncbi:MAG: sensor domain-containing diguanylate cyclase [Chloroflexota bacterium]